MKNFIFLFVAILVLVSTSNIASATVACCYTGSECIDANTAQVCRNTGGTPAAAGSTCDDDPSPCGRAQGAPIEISESLTTQDLGIENAGILPTNPFYFFKNWTRAIRRVFTFNPVKKAEFELKIANQKAAEIKKMEDVAPQNVGAITKATTNYQDNVERLRARLEGLKETSENPNVAELADQLTSRGLQHQQLFDELKVKFENSAEFVAEASNAQEAILAAVAVVPEKLESITQFGQRLENAVQGQKGEFSELRAAELVDRLEERFSEKTEEKLAKIEKKVEQAAPEDIAKLKEELAKIREENAGLRKEISALKSTKQTLLSQFGARLEAREIIRAEAAVAAPTPAPAAPSAIYQNLQELSGDKLRRSKLLYEVREKASPDVKSQLNVAAQSVIRQAEEQKEIGAEESKKMILEAERAIDELRSIVSAREGDISNAARQLLERAEFQLKQARAAYDAQNYGNAFGQANAARVVAENASRSLTATAEDYARDLESLRNFYDSLAKRAQEAGLPEEKAPKLFELLTQAEKQLLELTRLVNSKADSEQIVNGIGNTKFLLSTVEQLLRELIGQVAPAAVAPVSAPAATALQRVVSRCEALNRNLSELDVLLKAGRISEQDYKLKYESLKKELLVCEKESVSGGKPAPALAPTSIPASGVKLAPPLVSPSVTEVCAQEYNPVCGVNGKTYPNECHAKAAGVTVKYKGECQSSSVVPEPTAVAPIAPATVAPSESFFDVFVAIDENGQFLPSVVKVKKGGKVTWTNKSQRSVWPASAIHPTHTAYPESGGCIGSKFDACRELKPGETFTFVFNQVGGWKYHDHLNPSSTGAVEVVE